MTENYQEGNFAAARDTYEAIARQGLGGFSVVQSFFLVVVLHSGFLVVVLQSCFFVVVVLQSCFLVVVVQSS